jgi:RHS repeat-associated protein
MYDDVGNRTIMQVTDSSGTRNHVYSYDNIYQLTDVNYPVGYDYLATDTTFNYDATGNRTSVIDGGGNTSYLTNALNQYTSVGNVQYLYDKAGNMTYDGGNNMYAYDPENRLMTVTRSPNALSAACDTPLTLTGGGTGTWSAQTSEYCPEADTDAVQSPDISDDQNTYIETSVEGSGTVKFWWKISSQSGDEAAFLLDGQRQGSLRSGNIDWEQYTYTVSGSGSHTLQWKYSKDAGGSGSDDCIWVDHIEWTPSTSALANAVDSPLTYTTGGNVWWSNQISTYYYGGDAAQSGSDVNDNEESWMQTTVSVQTSGTVSFWWKVSSESNSDWLEFYVDDVRQDRISGTVDWQEKRYTISASGSHTLKWRYVKDGSGSAGSNCGWVDAVLWSTPEVPANVISYVYDPAGRRIEKKYDGLTQMKYLYDGSHIIAEYGSDGSLSHKYIYGPCIDEPICMIDVANSNATYYYHFDGLGSVIALTNSAGSVVNLYEYSVYGHVSASDLSHPNRFLFTGREFDKDTGLYYYRARYYNPYIGRFLQTDPVGYGDGMNLYTYCRNNPLGYTDPSGTVAWSMSKIEKGEHAGEWIRLNITDKDGKQFFTDVKDVNAVIAKLCEMGNIFDQEWMEAQAGWKLAHEDETLFWYLQMINKLGGGFDYAYMESKVTITDVVSKLKGGNGKDKVTWRGQLSCEFGPSLGPVEKRWARVSWAAGISYVRPALKDLVEVPLWWSFDGIDLTTLAHELQHAEDWLAGCSIVEMGPDGWSQENAIKTENRIRGNRYDLTPKAFTEPKSAYMRPGGNPEGPMPIGPL